jgi:hypothetical protein
MTPRSEAAIVNLRNGIQKMEESLSPLDRAVRKITAGRPARQAVDTPIGAVALAEEQRERLTRLLEEEGIQAHVLAQIITEQESPNALEPFPWTTDVEEGSTYKALHDLELFVREGGRFVFTGLKFSIEPKNEVESAHTITYTLKRSTDGQAGVLVKTSESQVKHYKRRTSTGEESSNV